MDMHQPPQPVRYQQYTPIEPPSGIPYAAFLRSWADDQVARWLSEIKCGCYQETFKANDIRGDVLLELDQNTLKELGIFCIGDRLRILNAVKILRQCVAAKGVTRDYKGASDGSKPGSRRLENVRPAPLQLSSTPNRGDLPALIREQGPDSARNPANPPVRPLPHPTQSTPPSNTTPSSSSHSVTPGLLRPNLPPLPPPPRGQPPLPPGRLRATPLRGQILTKRPLHIHPSPHHHRPRTQATLHRLVAVG
jgi:mitogen-activated protein kinase kinase kinase